MPVSKILAGLLILLTATPVAAQAPEAQSGPTMSVDVGVGGFSQPDRPSEIRATVSSPVLVTGRLRVSGGGMAVSRPVEVPAASEQTYELTVPPLEDSTRLTVELLDADGEAILSEVINTRVPSGEAMAVGVVGDEDLVQTLSRVRAVVTDRPVTAFSLPAEVDPTALGVVDYLILGREAGAAVEAGLSWARSGGRVVMDASLAGGDQLASAVPTEVDGVSRLVVGTGSVVAVENTTGRDVDEWSAILRPTPLDLSGVAEGGGMPREGLLNAASEAGDRQVPSIPWLLFAIIGFALVVGPVNFIVLSRLGKRDWAWLTIPTISLVALVGFWVAGRQRIAGTNLTHASVVVSESTTTVRSAVVVAAGAAGERRLEADPGYRIYPEVGGFGAEATELRLDGETSATVELGQLGFTGIGMTVTDADLALPTATLEEGALVVENGSNLTFWGWGAVAGGSSTVADGELSPGGASRVQIPDNARGDFGWTFIDALINRSELWNDPARSSSLWSLSQVLSGETDSDALYFVGLTDDYSPGIQVDGRPVGPVGPTMVVVQVEDAGSGQEAGAATADVVGTGFVNWADWGPQRVISTDELTVRFRLPDPSVEARLIDRGRFGMPASAYESWIWDQAAFEEIQPGDPLPSGAVSPDGEVYVRLIGANEFGDNPMSPSDLSLEWGT